MRSNISYSIKNPLISYKLIKRSVMDLKFYEEYFPGLKEKSDLADSIEYPDDNDLKGAIRGLVRLQKVYNLTALDLSEGVFNGVKTGIKLSNHDVFIIGKLLSELKEDNYFAKEFLDLALIQSTDEKRHEVTKKEIVETIFIFHLKNNEYFKANEALNVLDQQERTDLIQRHWISYYEAKIFENPRDDTFERNGLYSKEKEQMLLHKVCRGEVKKSPKEESKLTCRYHSTNAFTKLAPFKVQVANIRPDVLLFINAVSQNEISIVRKIFHDVQTYPSKVNSNDGSGSVNSDAQVSEMQWFYDTYNDIFKRLTQRTEVRAIFFFKLFKFETILFITLIKGHDGFVDENSRTISSEKLWDWRTFSFTLGSNQERFRLQFCLRLWESYVNCYVLRKIKIKQILKYFNLNDDYLIFNYKAKHC